jgi:hypothetical protein
MAYSFGKKASNSEWASKLKKWLIGGGIAGVVIGGPIYYHHFTEKTEVVELLSKDQGMLYVGDAFKEPGETYDRDRVIRNTTSTFARWLRGKDAHEVKLIDGRLSGPGLYELTTYGNLPEWFPLSDKLRPNALTARKVDLTETFKVVSGGYEVELTVPFGSKDRVKIESITAVAPAETQIDSVAFKADTTKFNPNAKF